MSKSFKLGKDSRRILDFALFEEVLVLLLCYQVVSCCELLPKIVNLLKQFVRDLSKRRVLILLFKAPFLVWDNAAKDPKLKFVHQAGVLDYFVEG